MGIDSILVPDLVDTSIFRPLGAEFDREAFCRRWKIPAGRYLIGSFQRDTEGHDLRTPKLVKGPDVFAEIVAAVASAGHPIHAVLAGPRRFWLRKKLAELAVPYTYIGEQIEGDDVRVNTLPRTDLNTLYNLVDLYLIGSRSEGGPHSVIEASAARCKIVSSRVGIASDALVPECVYDSLPKAVEIIASDMRHNRLAPTVDCHYRYVRVHNSVESVRERLRQLDVDTATVPPYVYRRDAPALRRASRVERVMRRVAPSWYDTRLVIGLWADFVKPPYGGGNQFMLALKRALQKKGIRVVVNPSRGADVHILLFAPTAS